MKRIILLLVLLFSISIFSQSKIEITKDGLSNTTQVIELNPLTAKEIYSRINKYIQKNYVSPKDVQKGNVENEFISFNGTSKYRTSIKSQKKDYFTTNTLDFYFSIDIKDFKIRLVITKLDESSHIEGFESSDYNIDKKINLLTFNYKEGLERSELSKDEGLKKQFLSLKYEKEKAINNLIDALITSIKNDNSNW
jgi:hypothetical protein